MNGTTHVNSTDYYPVPDPGNQWSIVGVADFSGNGRADILWRRSTGEVRLWIDGIPGTASISYQNQGGVLDPHQWVIRAVGDFDGNGKADIYWVKNGDQVTSSDPDRGRTAIWYMSGANWTGEAYFSKLTTDLALKGTGDFNGDGRTDLLFRNTTTNRFRIHFGGGGTLFPGQSAAGITEQCDGSAIASNCSIVHGPSYYNQYTDDSAGRGYPAPVSSAWDVVQIADFNHDGRDDILWRSGGYLVVWFLDGARFLGEASVMFPGETSAHYVDSNWETAGIARESGF